MSRRTHKTADAMLWLLTHMERGKPYRAGDLLEAGRAAGHSTRTLQAVAKELGIEPRYVNEPGQRIFWEWILPDDGEPASSRAAQLIAT